MRSVIIDLSFVAMGHQYLLSQRNLVTTIGFPYHKSFIMDSHINFNHFCSQLKFRWTNDRRESLRHKISDIISHCHLSNGNLNVHSCQNNLQIFV